MTQLSRRQFAALAAAAAAVPFTPGRRVSAAAPITAQEILDRIKNNVGLEWRSETVDGIKAGDSSTVVKGIVTASMATLSVLQQAVKAGANLVVTGQPTFYSRADGRNPPAGRGGAPSPPDPVFTAKNEFIAKHALIVIRLSDHWRMRQPNPLAAGMAAALNWTRHQLPVDPFRFQIPSLSLEAAADHVKKQLRVRGGIRVVGEPRIKVERVGVLPGSTPIQSALKLLPEVDAIVAGEVREWESVEYARDKVFAGERKGLILIGRIVSEEPGMDICASWLKTFVAEVPVRHISAGDPYWRPA